jgi:hypothetical protein
MNVEVGEYFVVKRGIKLNDVPFFSIFSSPFSESCFNKDKEDKPPRYDRSHEGRIYKALEVCGEHIAAECVFDDDKSSYGYQGKILSLNTSEVEIWPLTEKYVACFLINKSQP